MDELKGRIIQIDLHTRCWSVIEERLQKNILDSIEPRCVLKVKTTQTPKDGHSVTHEQVTVASIQL